MNKKKILKFSLLILTLIVILLFSLPFLKTEGNFTTWAAKSFEDMKDYSASGLFSKNFEYTTDDDNDRVKGTYSNFLCIERAATGSSPVQLKAVLDINIDGSGYDSYVVTYSNGSTRSGSDARMAKIAYLAYYAEQNKYSNIMYAISFAFDQVWEEEGVRLLIASDFPAVRSGEASKNTYYDSAKKYSENGQTTDGKVLSARVLLCGYGSAQYTALLYGGESEGVKFSIDKYITKVEDTGESAESDEDTDYGTSRAGKEDSTKLSNPVKIAYGSVKVHYKIKIKNEGTKKLKGKITDTYDGTFLSGLQGIDSSGENITIEPGETKTYNITLNGNTSITSGKYKNTAKFTPEKGKPKSSSDWIQIGEIKAPKINKYITKINTNSFSRSGLSETQKANSPANAGINNESKTISYTVKIKNENNFEIKGTFKDVADSEISLSAMKKGSDTITSGSEITIPANSTVTITFTGTVASNTTPNIYANTATFKYGTMSVESSDYFKIEGKTTSNATIKKYISSVSSSPGSFKSGRDSMSITNKSQYPAEVVKGSLVTYTIEIKNDVHYQNTSASCHGERCEEHLALHGLDYLKCTEIFDSSELKYSSITGSNSVTFNESESKIVWSNVAEDTTVTANITFEVVASNMKLTNIQNTVNNIEYEYKYYHCSAYHGIYYTVSCSKHGSHTYCTHTACGLNHPYDRVTGNIAGSDSDYVRVLDPEVGGVVFLDKDKNGLKASSGEEISGMTREDHKPVIVELWRTAYGSEGAQKVATRTVDTSTGKFTFGRVRKGPDRIITEGSVNEYDNIGTGNYFYYTSETLYNYYLVYYYDGERYISTIDAGMKNLNASDHYKMNATYPNDSNASENANERTTFNNSLETISYNKAYAGTTNSASQKNLTYAKEGTGLQKSIVKWEGTTSGSLTMKATSFTFYFNSGADGDDVAYLQHINLGLVEREKPNLSLTKDVVKAEVTINNHKTVYNYNSLGTSPYTMDNNNVLSKPYSLSIYREDYEYRTSKYPDTIKDILNENNRYNDLGRDNDLQIILTYKIIIKNDSPTMSAKVREIIDYSSEELEILPVTVNIDGTGLTVANSTSFSNPDNSGKAYNQHFIIGDALTQKTLASGESLEVELSYRVLKDANGFIYEDLTTDDISESKMNIAEIGAYSIYDGEKPAGLIDQNSNPGNIEFDVSGKAKVANFEDDTFETGILITLKDDPDPGERNEKEKYYYRNVSGIVFEEIDKSITSTSDGQLVGDGIKNGNDIGAKNVIVKLYEVVQKKDTGGNVTEEYYVDTGLWYRTGSDGRYYFGDRTEGFSADTTKPTNESSTSESKDDCYKIHPAIYTVRFIYGDEYDKLITTDGNNIKYSGQDYQSVKYTDVGVNNATTDSETEIVKPTAFSEKSGNTTAFSEGNPTLGSTIYSVAKDNEVRRLEVNQYSTTTTYPMDTILKANQGSSEAKLLSEHTAMFADSKMFDLDIEYYGNYDNKDEYTIEWYEQNTENGTQTKVTKTIGNYYYSVRDINFGITQRPVAKLQLMNDITEVRAITSDGNTLIDILFDIAYTKEPDGSIKHITSVKAESIGIENVQVLNREGNNQGFRYVNVDTDLLQGMTITIKFRNAVANISEVDHLAKWLEEKIESQSAVDLKVGYTDYIDRVESTIDDTDSSKVTDYINGQERQYNYINSYLYKLLYVGDSSKGINALKDTTTGVYVYDGIEGVGSENVKNVYTYTNIKNKSHNDYSVGYYLGNIYYNNVSSGNEAKVKTKVDQYIDYVDNDLIFKPEENINENGQITYLTYTTEEIAEKGLLKDITPDVHSISDGKKDYYNKDVPNTNNNLAFNIENGAINADFYKFLEPIIVDSGEKIAKEKLYNIDLQASRILTSELDLEGVIVDNIAEIIKSTNTAGRKIYVKASGNNTGYLGNTTKDPIESVNKPGSLTTIVDIAKLELDTDFTEYVTFSPPTGLVGQDATIKTIVEKTGDLLLIIIPVVIIIAGMSYVTVQVIKRKKFYK